MITITLSPSNSKRVRHGLAASVLFGALMTMLSPGVLAAKDIPLRTASELDIERLGRIGIDERSLLRVEWKAGLSRVDEAGMVSDMLGSIGRMEKTTRELHGLVNAIPERSGGSSPPAPTTTVIAPPSAVVLPTVALPEADLGANMAIKLGAIAAGTVLVLMLFWRRRQASAAASATVISEPSLPAAPKVKPKATRPSKPPAAVPPAPTSSPDSVTPTAVATATSPPGTENDGNPEQALELANIMLSMGLTSGATQTLVEHIRTNPRDALYHWLKLLEIYRTSGHRSDFKEAAEQLRQHFNIQAEDWNKIGLRETPLLENYSRIMERLLGLWSDPDACNAFLRDLLEDNRGGTREGFPQPVAEEILLLIELQKQKLTAA